MSEATQSVLYFLAGQPAVAVFGADGQKANRRSIRGEMHSLSRQLAANVSHAVTVARQHFRAIAKAPIKPGRDALPRVPLFRGRRRCGALSARQIAHPGRESSRRAPAAQKQHRGGSRRVSFTKRAHQLRASSARGKVELAGARPCLVLRGASRGLKNFCHLFLRRPPTV